MARSSADFPAKAPAHHAAATPLLLLDQGIPDLQGRLAEGSPGGGFTASARVDAGR